MLLKKKAEDVVKQAEKNRKEQGPKTYENEICLFKIKGDILYVKYKVEHLDLEGVKKVIEGHNLMVAGKDYPCFVDSRKVRYWIKGSRYFLFENLEHVSAVAIYSPTFAVNIIFNWIFAVIRTPFPVKRFYKKPAAENWLLKIHSIKKEIMNLK